jgi:Fur family transcriptional regulator, ferric uptake regulator
MTVAGKTPPLVFDTIEEAIQAVHKAGMRLSTPRRLVLQALFAAEGPTSAVHLAQTLAIDESSVYRNLEVLERHGLIRHVHLGHGPGLYALVGRHQVEYLYCERCAKVTAATPKQLDPVRKSIKKRFGYEARFTHFAIVGLCEHCAALPRPAADTDAEGTTRDRTHGGHPHTHGNHVHSHPTAGAPIEQPITRPSVNAVRRG